MHQIADLHIHSKYSRSCSKDLELPKIAQWCEWKGINLVSTGDFTHPKWLAEIKNNLESDGNGFYKLKDASVMVRQAHHDTSASANVTLSLSKGDVRFILGTEISSIYKQGDKCRRIHTCIYFPSIEDVEKFNEHLEKLGCNLKSDGRPIVKLSVKELAEISLNINPKALIIPAHAWTPWFSVFGSKSGFDTLEEAFEEFTPYIYAIETGLSSDPLMNWHLSALDNVMLVSNSDAHSPANLGREANIFEMTEFTYDELWNILKNRDKKKFLSTVEFFPEEGKYHYDGHANCGVSLLPEQTEKNKGLCPVCKKPLVVGVFNRVFKLADRKETEIDKSKFVPYKSLVPLQEIIAEAFDQGKGSKKVQTEYFNLIKKHTEFEILLDLSIEEIKKLTDPIIAEGIKRVREGSLHIEPGYDGVYGVVKIFNDKERKGFEQTKLI